MNISKIEIVPLRTAFPHEALNFTIWLESNIDALCERIDMELTVIKREKSAGSFSVDLYCEDDNNNYVVIENQIEKSNHDHLGKLLTYMINLDAKIAIWIVAKAQPEHQRVIDWLNESTSSEYSFYLVQVEAIRIDNSPYAPLFTVVAEPSERIREIGDTKKELAERHVLRQEFWTLLLEKNKNTPFAGIKPNIEHVLRKSSGKTGVTFRYAILKDSASIELYIDQADTDENKRIFDQMYNDRFEIEKEFGEQLEWARLNDRRASKIAKSFKSLGGLNDKDTWSLLQDTLIDAMLRFHRVFHPRIKNIK